MSDTQISVRHVEVGDAEALHRIMTSPQVVRNTLRLPYQCLEARRQRLGERTPDLYTLVACVAGEVVGTISLQTTHRPRRAHAGALGMAVRDDWQGRGVGTAMMKAIIELAEQWLNLKRIELEVYTDNAPAVALYKRFDFEIEGTLRQFAFRDRQYVDAYYMARVRG